MTEITAEPDIRFERVTGTLGAFVHGVQLGASEGPAIAETLQRGLHEHGVLFFEFDHIVEPSEFVALADLFGEREEVYKLTSNMADAPFIDSDLVPMRDYRVNFWHSDGTALEFPPQAALLTPVELPEVGGDTMWASMYAAWESLGSHYQRLLEGLEVHNGTTREPFLRPATAVHPAVIRDAVTGRQMLFVNSNYSERFVGMPQRQSDELLRMLFDHVNTPEFHVRLRWRPGVVAVWEERVTQHRGVADFVGPRKLRRLTLAGDRPAA